MIGIGIAGCGHIGTVHAYALKLLVDLGLVDARVVATHDIDPARAERVAALHDGARPVATVDELVARADAVWICTWTAAHLPVARVAAAADRAVFCEKPLATDLAQCVELAAVLRPLRHHVGLVLRHAPVFLALGEAVRSGRYGAPLATVFRDDQYFPIQGIYGSDWRADASRAGGGTLLEHSIHDVDLLRTWFGDPDQVRAVVGNRSGYAGIEDHAAVTFRYPDGSTASLTSVWHQVLSRESSRRVEVFCEDALLWTDDDYLGPLHVQTSAGDALLAGEPPEWYARVELPDELALPLSQYAEPSRLFLAAIGAGERPACSVDDALGAHRLVELAYESAAEGGAARVAL